MTGLIGYGLASTQGTIEAFRSANIYWHFTNFTVGHSHATMYGFIAFIAWGAVYGLLPRLTGREPNPLAVGVHFWLALVGVLTYVIAISVAGVLQGFAWVAGTIVHRFGDRRGADVALADHRRSLDGQ